MSEDFSLWVVGLRRFVTLRKSAPYRNVLLTYLVCYDLQLNCVCVDLLLFVVSCEADEQDVKDEVDIGAEEDVDDSVDDVMLALRRRPVSRSSSTTKRSRAELVTHQDFQPALVAADDGWF